MCSQLLNGFLSARGIRTRVYYDRSARAGEYLRALLPGGKVLLLADQANASLSAAIKADLAGFKVISVVYGEKDRPEGLFSLPDDVRGTVAVGERSALAARFFTTLRGGYCILLPVRASARGIFERSIETCGEYPLCDADAVIADELLMKTDAAEIAECALSSLFAEDIDIDGAFTGRRKEDAGYGQLRAAQKFLCAEEIGAKDLFNASACLALARACNFRFPADAFLSLLIQRSGKDRGACALETLLFFTKKYSYLFNDGHLRPFYVADYAARAQRAAETIGKRAFSLIAVPSLRESFERERVFAESRRRFCDAMRLLSDFADAVKEKYYAAGGKRGAFGEDLLNELFSFSADLSPFLSVGALMRDFGVRCA